MSVENWEGEKAYGAIETIENDPLKLDVTFPRKVALHLLYRLREAEIELEKLTLKKGEID